MKTYLLADPVRYPRMTTQELRETFLVDSLAASGELRLAYIDLDRAVVGIASPTDAALSLPADEALRARYFLERRELGALNIGGSGRITVDGTSYELNNLDCLYIGRGNEQVLFEADDRRNPAVFYLLSYPAHCDYPVWLIRKEDANPTELGSAESSNQRVIYKYIHLQGARSCQLVMGVTHLELGSVWNTMPPHTHMRRSEIYLYFNLDADNRVVHLMGPPNETRHLIVSNRELAISPGWSIHAGAGTGAYSFCWGMGGENQDYADMDPAAVASLR